MAEAILDGAEPRTLWRRFLDLTRIPRPPREEERARAYVRAWAAERGLPVEQDVAGNVVVRVPASPGRERAPTVVLQAHLDMVCERDPESPYDARAGRICVVREGDWVRAEGTTLGADNGIGAAAALAVAEDGSPHGPLELLLTVCEEQGLEGAKALDPALVSGRLLLNLDGTSDDGLTVGCAGSAHTLLRLPLAPVPPPPGSAALQVALTGGRGGHSGADIHRGRANAIVALGRVLSGAWEGARFRLARLAGGQSRNAIPREAEALVLVPAGVRAALEEAARAELEALRDQHGEADPGLALALQAAEPAPAADEARTRRALDLLAAVPSGVLAVHPELPGVVETSTSLGVAATEDGALTLRCMSRSARAPALAEVVARLEAIARLTGAHAESAVSYPPWRPDLSCPLLTSAQETFRRLRGTEPQLEVVHGGLECAVIGAKLPGIRMLSLGPEIREPHAPGERVSVSSTERFYALLLALLDELSRP